MLATIPDMFKFEPEARASLASSLADNRPADRGPSLSKCRGRWTQRPNRTGSDDAKAAE